MVKTAMNKETKIYVAGHRGLVGGAIFRALQQQGYTNLIVRTHEELDLMDTRAVELFFKKEAPEYVFLAAAKVGGIMANKLHPADFIYQNLVVQNNVIHAAYQNNVTKLLFLGSSCIYPKLSPQPIKEEYLMTGKLEETNVPYSIAKIVGIVMCQSYNKEYGTNYISVMPCNLYGPGDNFDLTNSHVLPALMRKFDEATETKAPMVELWGSGAPRREFLHVDDVADGCIFLMKNYNDSEIVNLGAGTDISIRELANIVEKITGYRGKIRWDASKPDGTPLKLLDVTKLHHLGWKHRITLEDGIRSTYTWYKANQDTVRMVRS